MKEINSTYNKFGKKMKELLVVVNSTDNWEKYVDDITCNLIKDLLQYNNISAVMEKNAIKYTNLRNKYINALDRIKNKNVKKMRHGKSDKAQKLFNLINTVPNWQSALTDKEILYVNCFKEYKNFYEVGRKLGAKPSNIAGMLYGTKQKIGVIKKLENLKNIE